MDMKERLKDNLNYSKRLCELLNENCVDSITYTAIASSDDIGVRQLLDKTGLHYNEIFYKDEIKDQYNLSELVNVVYTTLETGNFKYVYPTEKAKRIYNLLKTNDWDIYLDQEELYIDEGINVEDILRGKITKDFVKFEVDEEFYDYKAIVVTKDKDNDFNIEYIK
jgi:Fe-S cluster biosynthesis and repair protein YggX